MFRTPRKVMHPSPEKSAWACLIVAPLLGFLSGEKTTKSPLQIELIVPQIPASAITFLALFHTRCTAHKKPCLQFSADEDVVVSVARKIPVSPFYCFTTVRDSNRPLFGHSAVVNKSRALFFRPPFRIFPTTAGFVEVSGAQ